MLLCIYYKSIMVKYPRSTCLMYFCLLIALAVSASKQPIPSCSSPKFELMDLPISLQETQTYNMNNFFGGYNLNITLPQTPKFVYLSDKLVKTKVSAKTQKGLKNYHLSHNGNEWGDTLITLSEEGTVSKIRWGVAKVNDTLPDLANEVIVESQKDITCFDAIWLRAKMIAMVDCTMKTVFGLQNIFIYVNTTSHVVMPGTFKNDMYVPFNEMRRRKVMLHQEDGNDYLVRCYFADAIDAMYAHNTYVEILMISNPLKPWTIRIMDRSFLHQDKLSIEDFKVYLGDIYILDYHSGVIKFDITPSQTIVIVGRYRTDSGYRKLGVYSNNLDNEFLLVLANDHAIFEVDWSNQIKPITLTKYTIMDESILNSLWVNEQYVVAQIKANVTDSRNITSETHSTYIFSRGTRTYMNAYSVIPHSSAFAFADFNRDISQVMTIDEEALTIYQVDQPILSIIPMDSADLNKEFSFFIKAESRNEYTSESLICTFTMKFLIVPADSMAIWPTGLHLPDTYYANYPGQLFIPLDRYVIGANITYGVYDSEKKEPPVHYILQQNSTRLFWDKKPTLSKITFLRQEQYDSIDETDLYIYTQDATNATHFTKCTTVPFTDAVHCAEEGNISFINFVISNLTANRFHYYEGKYLHLAAIVYSDIPNEIFIYDVERSSNMSTKPIMFATGYEGKIQSIEFLGHYLVVVLKYVKEIVFFDMIECHDHQERECREIYRIDSIMMDRIGVKYFSPVQVYTSDFHPFVLFVQCLDRVLILDITRNGPILLTEVMSPASQEVGSYKWQMAIARGHLILVNPPNIIEEHSLEDLYTKRDAHMTKTFPTYGYVIPDKFDLDFSDNGNLVYITAIDPALPASTNSIIIVYRPGGPAVSAFYDVFHINAKYDDMLIDCTGNFGDYVSVALGSMLLIFRQYQIPILVFEDTWDDFAFNLTYTNDPQHRYHYLQRSMVKIANYPEDIVANNSDLNKTGFLTNQISYNKSQEKKKYDFDDSTWFNGSVLNYTFTNCSECNQKLKVINHVHEERRLFGTMDMEDYVFTFDGGVIQQFQSIIKMRHNGSVEQFTNFPSVFDGESCILIQHSMVYDYTLSACSQGDQVYLYTTVYTASKPFVNGPYYSSARNVAGLHVMEDIMILVDVDENPWRRNREGGVLIYAMNHDPFEPQIFDELEFIDTNDLTVANDWPGGPCFIGNAHIAFTNETDIYRLVLTEVSNGLFVVDFRWRKGRKSVQILKVQFINLKEELLKNHLPLPNMAFFTAVGINKQYYDKTFGYWQTELIVVTSNFHTFEVNLHIDSTGTVVSHEITRVYYRYGFYENNNYIKCFDGYFALTQRLPTNMEVFDWFSKQVLSVYDTRERWEFNQTQYLAGTNIPVEFMLGGYTFRTGRVGFDFNFTFVRNSSNPIGSISLLAVHNRDAMIRQFSIRDKLSIETSPNISSAQYAKLRAQNDFHYLQIKLDLIIPDGDDDGEGQLPGWAIALIVIGSVAISAGIGYFLFIKFIKPKSLPTETEAEKSLLEKEGEDESSDGEDDDDDEDEDDDGQGSEGSRERETENAVADSNDSQVKVVESDQINNSEGPTSINRETISSVAQDEESHEVEPEVEQEAEKQGEKQGEDKPAQ